jgi:hypothetical protein
MSIQTMILDIKKRGSLSEAEIATRVGCSQPTVTRLKNGVHHSTSYQIGLAIERLHREICSHKLRLQRKKRAEAPA